MVLEYYICYHFCAIDAVSNVLLIDLGNLEKFISGKQGR